MARAHNERCFECKKSIKNLLSALYGAVETNYDLDLPSSLSAYDGTGLYDSLQRVYSALQHHRGFSGFVMSSKLRPVDFFVPQKALIVEFD